MKNEVLIATTNKGKLHDYAILLAPYDIKIIGMEDVGFDSVIEETGSTYEENAIIKVQALIDKVMDRVIISDDSGLEIQFLNGAPGLYSARFLGEDISYAKKSAYILEKLKGVPREKRKAQYVTTLALYDPHVSNIITFDSIVHGYISTEPRGTDGFDYDRIFEMEDGLTMAEHGTEFRKKYGQRVILIEKAIRSIKIALL